MVMQRYVVNQFDKNTFIVIDQMEQREVCICGNYANWMDAKERAEKIAVLLNINDGESKAKK
jgi:hypothetical protein